MGTMNADGGALEIVEYNEANGYAYAVSGVDGSIIAVKTDVIPEGAKVADLTGSKTDVSKLVKDGLEGFTYGDLTSISVSPDGTKLAAAIQHEGYATKGAVAIFECNADGSLANPKLVSVGVQPDMLTYTPDGSKILVANEGEPREAYTTDSVDPKGSVSIIDTMTNVATEADFTEYDAAAKRAELVADGIVLKKDAAPSVDLEPEYIATNNAQAYVTLQEANAVAVLDLTSGKFTSVNSLGTVDYSKVEIDLNKDDKKYEAANYEDVLGLRMPDGIATYDVGGKSYILTANEGDSREWGTEGEADYYCNETSAKLTSTKGVETGKKVTYLDSTLCDGLEDGKTYLYGARSYSVFEVTKDGLSFVYDSGSDFESLTAKFLPDNFNASNDDIAIDDRSNKKGPEAESVVVGTIGEHTFAFIGLERIGGVMVYDITDPTKPEFSNYMNSRDFSDAIKGDVSPEGLCFVAATGSSKPKLLTACEVSGTLAVYELTDSQDDVAVLYSNDVHNAYEATAAEDGTVLTSGYAEVAYMDKKLKNEGYEVTIVDAGDALQGGTIGTLSKGSYIVDIMNQAGYDIAVPGNHEFDYGMDNFLDLAKNKAKFDYVSSNFKKISDDSTVFDGYKIVEYAGKKIAYVGITTPETFSKSTPTFFQDDKGNYIYSFAEGNDGKDLYDTVQKSVDAAKKAGADYVVAVGHIGTDESSEPWTSTSIISHTSGINAFIDGHSHSTIAQRECTDKDGKKVTLTSTGSYFESFGKMMIQNDGTVSTELINVSEYKGQDAETLAYLNEVKSNFAELEKKKVASTDVDLVVTDPVSGKRMIRNQETNLGDLCADAYRDQMGADIAFVNGGGIRANITKGDVTYGNIVSVHPYGNMACLIEATGQEILDALELGARATSTGESGGFLQVSGLSYEIDSTFTSNVVLNDQSEFVKVDGKYRVSNVKVGNEALDLTKTYKLASHNYMLKSGGDGYTMFKDNKILLDETLIDNQVLINYITETLGGNIASDSIYAKTYGEGRIKVILKTVAATTEADGYRDILQGDSSYKEVLPKLSTPGDDTPAPSNTPEASNTPVPSGTPVPSNTPVPSGTLAPAGTTAPTTNIQATSAKKNDTITSGSYKYVVTNASKTKGAVTVKGFASEKNAAAVKIPDTIKKNGVTYRVTAIANKAFDKSKKLKKVTVGNNVVSIGSSAFASDTALTTVVLGKSVKTIGKSAFAGNKKLKNITIKSTLISKVGAKAFSKIAAKAKISVPAKKLKAYKKTMKNKGQSSSVKIVK